MSNHIVYNNLQQPTRYPLTLNTEGVFELHTSTFSQLCQKLPYSSSPLFESIEYIDIIKDLGSQT